MYIYDGPTTGSPLLGTYTGTTAPPNITSSGGALTIRFTSDNATTRSGWIADWTCNQSSLPTYNNPILLDTTQAGNIDCALSYHDFYDSGNSGGFYANNENHTMTFCNPDTTRAIRLSFRPNPTPAQQVSISSTNTSNDYLYFYNGADTVSNLIGAYTGASSTAPQPGTFITSDACLTVKMSSDNAFVGNGFIARLYCADKPTQLPTVYVGGTEGNKTFTDDGGTAANYSNNNSYIVSYCPDASAPAGEVVWAAFLNTVGIERNWDYLYVFDGDDTENSRLICTYTGNASDQNVLNTIKASVDNPSGCLTFQFFSDVATVASGWEANMTTGEARLSFGGESCADATLIASTGRDYAGSTALHTGEPGTNDPSLNISVPTLTECSGSNEITRLENTTWYRFVTPDTLCVAQSMNLRLNNISCQSEGTGGSGVQLVLYEAASCQGAGGWPQPVYCADKLLSGDSVDVQSILQPSTSYYVMIDGFTGQNCNFDLQFDVQTNGNPNSCSLPLDWLGFWGYDQQSHIQLKWETANEQNVAGFYIQRAKRNGVEFEDVGYVSSISNGQTNGGVYTFDDYDYWRNAVNYYRLREVDTDGYQAYSSIISIDKRHNKQEIPVKVYPNPAQDIVTFAVNSPYQMPYQLRIYDLTGRTLFELAGEVPVGYWTEQLNVSQLAAGAYVYRLQVGTQTINGKFEKQ